MSKFSNVTNLQLFIKKNYLINEISLSNSSLYGSNRNSRYTTPEPERDFVMHVHGAARARAPAPAPRATFIANTDMPFRRPKKVTNTNQESWYLVRRASSTGEVTEGKVPPNEKGCGQRPKKSKICCG